ncbi:unnamed protein product [Dracunculus medinensis]|uniref:Aldo_ket_red domain-containing protein n=1 Tax=Dracunculus medinensis TaxID=318479 RepID=A0A0N4U3X0_DRAME|nr:unnamed protein product [Dracunculus medinensis]
MVIGGATLRLSTGNDMPAVGLGTWLSKPDEVRNAVCWAIEVGYRLIDTAHIYGNEEAIGEALAQSFKAGKIKRDDIFITTKLWCTHNRPEFMEEQMKESLRKLKLDYVDLYLVHMPATFDREMKKFDETITVEDIWKGMEALFDKKYTKAIGVSNFNLEQLKRVQKIAKVPIHNVQNECHLYLPQNEIIEYCKKNNITFTSYASIGSGGRSEAQLPNYKLTWASAPNSMEEASVKKFAAKYKKSSAQILLRYLLQRGIAVIPKSINKERIKENFDIFDFQLSGDEMKEMEAIKTRARLFYQDFMVGHPEYPFTGEVNPGYKQD